MTHSQIGKYIAENSGLRIITTITPFEALSRSIFSQQISLNVALNMRKNFIKFFGREHSLGMMCYPESKNIINVEASEIKQKTGCSTSKANTIYELAQLINSGKLNIDVPLTSLIDLKNQLLSIKGIGPWTVNNFFMRAYGYESSSMHSDLGIRTILQKIMNSNNAYTPATTEEWLNQFNPYKSLVAEYLGRLRFYKRPRGL